MLSSGRNGNAACTDQLSLQNQNKGWTTLINRIQTIPETDQNQKLKNEKQDLNRDRQNTASGQHQKLDSTRQN